MELMEVNKGLGDFKSVCIRNRLVTWYLELKADMGNLLMTFICVTPLRDCVGLVGISGLLTFCWM